MGLFLAKCAQNEQVCRVVIQLTSDTDEAVGDADVEVKVRSPGCAVHECVPLLSGVRDKALATRFHPSQAACHNNFVVSRSMRLQSVALAALRFVGHLRKAVTGAACSHVAMRR